MSEQEDLERYRYLQLKQKMASGQASDVQSQPSELKGLASRAWDALEVPSQMSSEGLTKLASYVPKPEPTGNIPMDVIKGTPRIAADTLAEAAPGFISRGALLTGAASKALPLAGKALAPVGRWGAGVLEDWAGIKPGAVTAAAKDPTLIFAKGKAAAGPSYNAAKAELEGASLFKDMYKPEEIIDTAKAYLAKGGKLEPAEALTYRKALDVAGRSRNVVKDGLVDMRSNADAMAKESENISEGDRVFKRGVQAESLRGLFPRNVGGRASPFKVAEGGFLAKTLGLPGVVAAGAMSPLAIGSAATIGGITSRLASNPELATAVQQFIQQYYSRGTNGQEQ